MQKTNIMKQIFKNLTIILMLVLAVNVYAQDKKWSDVHKVKKSETLFGIANDYGVSIQDLIDANPEMKQPGYKLKKGDWIFVPYAKKDDKKAEQGDKNKQQEKNVQQAPASVSASELYVSDKAKSANIRVGIMLPLHNEDGDGKRMVEYYRGILLAVNQLKAEGINTEISAWNVPINADIRATLQKEGVDKLDVIFGPLYSNMVKPLADYCKQKGIKLVIPFSITGNDVYENQEIFQVYQTPEELNNKAVTAFLERFKNHHPIFIDCNDATSDKGKFTAQLRKQLQDAKRPYNLTSLSTPQTDFAKAFSPDQPNVIIVNSARSPQLNQTFAKLDTLKTTHPGLAISMFGYTEWLMYQRYDLSQFFKYSVYIPTTFYYNAVSSKTKQLEKSYEESFGEKMMQDALPRFAITGYDQAMFFIRGLSRYGTLFTGSPEQTGYKPLQTGYKFTKTPNGGYKNSQFQLIHFMPNQTMEAIIY